MLTTRPPKPSEFNYRILKWHSATFLYYAHKLATFDEAPKIKTLSAITKPFLKHISRELLFKDVTRGLSWLRRQSLV